MIINKFVDMGKSFLEKLNEEWSRVFYTTPLVIVFTLLTISIGVKYYRKEKTRFLFIIYALSCLALIAGVDFYRILSTPTARNKSIAIQSANMIFGLIEFTVFNCFFFKIINSKISRQLMTLFFILFFILVTFFYIKIGNPGFNKSEIIQLSSLITAVEFFLLLFPIFVYFFELFIKNPIEYIAHSPSLWITSGLFIYCLATLPFLLISEPLSRGDRHLYILMFSVHFVSLSLLFLTIIKAFLCRRSITT
jgi:hypothetical protein